MTTVSGGAADQAWPGKQAGRWRWPLPALLAWGLAWVVFVALRGGPWPAWLAFGGASATALAWLPTVSGLGRRLSVVAGFPASALALAWGWSLPAWAWLLPLGALLLLYPMRAWADAPLYPTAPDALAGLHRQLDLPAEPRMLDAGCGLGHGLLALRREWPQARLAGVERSFLLAAAARVHVRRAKVQWADMWQLDWAGHDLVYLFQRPESMARAWAKAQAEMASGAWLVSLEFTVPGREPELTLRGAGRRTVYAYRVGGGLPGARPYAGGVTSTKAPASR